MQYFKKIVLNILLSEDHKRLCANFISLTFLQGVNYLIPLITFPYIVRVIGVENYGLLAFASALNTYFLILTDYGFNLSATRKIAIYRNDKDKVIEIFSTVMTIQFTLMLISFLLMLFIITGFQAYRNDWEVYFLSFGIVIGQVFFPIWFFQGMEQMKYITFLNIFMKCIFTLLIFIFVLQEKDFYKVPMLNTIGTLLTGFIAIILIKIKFDISFKFQPVSHIITELKDGWYIFTSRIFVSLYTTTNVFLLGLMTNNLVVGYYSIADRIISISCKLFSVINQTVYPYMSRLRENSFHKFLIFFRRLIKAIICCSIFLFFILYTFGDQIIYLLIKEEPNKCINTIYLFLLFTVLTNPFGPLFTQTLLIFQMQKEFNTIVKTTFLLNIILAPIFISLFSGEGLAFVTLISQIFVVLFCYIFIKKGFIHATFRSSRNTMDA